MHLYCNANIRENYSRARLNNHSTMIIVNTIFYSLYHIYFKNHRCVKMGQSIPLDEHHNIIALFIDCFSTVFNFFFLYRL